MKTKHFSIFCFVLALVLTVGATPSTGENKITPPDVYVQVSQLLTELKVIQHHMGKPENRMPEISVTDVSPREVYFQAMTLLRKANQFNYDISRDPVVSIPDIPDDIISSDVFKLVKLSLIKVRSVKNKLGIKEESVMPERDNRKKPSDVFRSIVQATRQLNLMIDMKYSPINVFPQMKVAVQYATLLLGDNITEVFRFECCKYPQDVYRRLLKCFNLVEQIANRRNVKMLRLRVSNEEILNATPSEVYELTSTLISELAYLNHLEGKTRTFEIQYAGRKFPSHVYQEAGILERQLQKLLQKSK